VTGKRIILLLDGTWNDEDMGDCDTNIVRLQEMIAHTLWNRDSSTIPNSPAPHVRSFNSDGKQNVVFYERGVGTGFNDRLKGGIFGEGLSENIRRAYKFLSFYYSAGDQIFIFGFSRGSYTARSLVGYLGAIGLLRAERCTPEREAQTWGYYRTNPNDRSPGIWTELTSSVHDRGKFRVECVGVFDTVGALGIPIPWFYLLNRTRFEFHDVELSSIANTNLHALAIDERREAFEASVWKKPKFKHFTTTTEQVWFSGAHADIGGSYIPEDLRRAEFPQALDDITLDWMLRRILAIYPDFPCNQLSITSASARGILHNSRKTIYRLFKNAFRSIANSVVEPISGWQEEIGRNRHASSYNEMIHVSALERLGTLVLMEQQAIRYLPPNLLAVLPLIERTYANPTNQCETEVKIVCWDGTPLEPQRRTHNETAGKILTEVKERLIT
jgi:hypothetical protein